MFFINYLLYFLLLLMRILKFRIKIRKNNKKLFKKIDKRNENDYKDYWKSLFPFIDVSWFRFYSNYSKVIDKKYVPEDIFYSIIERKLNDVNYSRSISDKNNYDINFNRELFPEIILKNISGVYLNSNNEIIKKNEAELIFNLYKEDIIVKPSINSGGGKNIIYLKNEIDASETRKYSNLNDLENLYKYDFCLQKLIKQHDFFSQFNKTSLNTIRIFIYRSILNNDSKILHCILRLGKKNMYVDNVSSGGIFLKIDINSGYLNDFALSRKEEKVYRHPDSGIIFKDKIIPRFNEICLIAKEIILKIPSHRIISVDMCLNNDDQVKVIEINTVGVGINEFQLFGDPLFGEYTEEIIDYCKNKKTDNFEYFRTTK
jgi:hypothetical protein